MLSIHETEEIRIGDKTPFDNMSDEEKLHLGKIAVDTTCSSLKKKDFITSLIDEFNAKETPEAQFAYLCDKMECDLQSKKYSDEGRCSFENVSDNIMNNKRVQEIIKNGAKTVADVFIEYDIYKYAESSIFSEMIYFLKEYNTKND